MPEIVLPEYGLQVVGRVRDMLRFRGVSETLVEAQSCRSTGILSIGLDESMVATSPQGKADCAAQMTDMA